MAGDLHRRLLRPIDADMTPACNSHEASDLRIVPIHNYVYVIEDSFEAEEMERAGAEGGIAAQPSFADHDLIFLSAHHRGGKRFALAPTGTRIPLTVTGRLVPSSIHRWRTGLSFRQPNAAGRNPQLCKTLMTYTSLGGYPHAGVVIH